MKRNPRNPSPKKGQEKSRGMLWVVWIFLPMLLFLDSNPLYGEELLDAEDRAWLRDHPVIRVVQDPGWPPTEFENLPEWPGII